MPKIVLLVSVQNPTKMATILDQLNKDLKESLSTIQGMPVAKEKISLFVTRNDFVGNPEDSDKVAVLVPDFFEMKDRTPDLIKKFTQTLGETVAKHFPNAAVECIVHMINPEISSWKSPVKG